MREQRKGQDVEGTEGAVGEGEGREEKCLMDGLTERLFGRRTLWGNEARARAHIGGSTSSSIAEHLAIAAVPR